MAGMFHKLVWIDHQCARIYDFTRAALQETSVIPAPAKPGHVHHHAGTPGPGHAALDIHYLKKVADAITDAKEILIVGPGDAKSQFSRFVRDRMPGIAAHVIGVEPHDRGEMGELHSFARRFFARADRMLKLK